MRHPPVINSGNNSNTIAFAPKLLRGSRPLALCNNLFKSIRGRNRLTSSSPANEVSPDASYRNAKSPLIRRL
jgi:hypothetical protein